MAIYAIDGPDDLSSYNFNKLYVPKLEKILEDPNAQILITDSSGCGILTSRYLKNNYYRNAIIYHLGDKPKHNLGNLPVRGGFISKAECTAQMMMDAKYYINFYDYQYHE
jgi:hypothetical protein